MKVMLVQFGITLQSLWSHSGYAKVRLKKTLVFPTDFNGFIKRWRLTCRIEKQISLMIMSIRMRFGCILGPFGSVLRLSGRIECKFAADRPQVGPKSAPSRLVSKLNTFCQGILMYRAPRTSPRLTAPHRASAPGNSKRYQSAIPYD